MQSPNFVLNKLLPFKVDKDKGKAKFDSDKCILEVTLPLIKKHIIDELKLFLAQYKELKTLYSFYEDQNNNGSTTENT